MTSMLRSHAVAAVNKGHTSSFYDGEDKNPVFQALDQEVNDFKVLITKIKAPGYKPTKEESASRGFGLKFFPFC